MPASWLSSLASGGWTATTEPLKPPSPDESLQMSPPHTERHGRWDPSGLLFAGHGGTLCMPCARLHPQPLAGGGATSTGSVPSLGLCQKCLRFGLAVTFRGSVEPETLATSAWLCFRGH